jgi:hypothetical protein
VIDCYTKPCRMTLRCSCRAGSSPAARREHYGDSCMLKASSVQLRFHALVECPAHCVSDCRHHLGVDGVPLLRGREKKRALRSEPRERGQEEGLKVNA